MELCYYKKSKMGLGITEIIDKCELLLEGRLKMGSFAKIADKFSGLVDVIMPLNDEYEEEFDEGEEELAEKKKQKSAMKSSRRSSMASASYAAEYKVSNGDPIMVERPAYGRETGAFRQKKSQPQLTVHTTKQPQLKMQIYAPKNFEQVTAIADDLKAGKACVVNYEQIRARRDVIAAIVAEGFQIAISRLRDGTHQDEEKECHKGERLFHRIVSENVVRVAEAESAIVAKSATVELV